MPPERRFSLFVKAKVGSSRNAMPTKSLLLALVLTSTAFIPACDDSGNAEGATGNFVAEVSGAVPGQVSGPGLISFIQPYDANFGTRPGYFFVADDSGVREIGITFTIPANARPGTYHLVSAHPMDAGKEFEVRVDRSVKDRTDFFQLKTEGRITLDSFPADGNSIAGSRVTGSFEFSTQDRSGKQVTAKGSFDFEGR